MLGRLLVWLNSSQGDEGLAQRVLHSGLWAILIQVSNRALSLGTTIFLANILAPQAFGLVGIAALLTEILPRLSSPGFSPALIQRKESNVDKYLDTVWTVETVRSLVLFGLCFAGAPYVAEFFRMPLVEPVFRVYGLIIVFNGIVSPAIIYFRKDLDFRKQFVYKLSKTGVFVLVAVVSAVVLENVWAIVFASVLAEGVQVGVSYLITDYRPSISLDYRKARELFSFGKWIYVSTIVVTLATQGDDAFVGWFLSASALGLYQIAFRYSNAPATEVTHVIMRVMFPAYSKLQDDTDATRSAFSSLLDTTLSIVVPMSVGILLITPEFVRVAFGSAWVPMVPAMQIMAVAGLFRSVATTGGSLFRGMGVPEWDFKMNAVRTVVIFATIWPLSNKWGITGAALSVTLGIGFTLPLWFYKTKDILGMKTKRYVTSVTGPLVASLVMAVPVTLVKTPTVPGLLIGIVLGAILYPVVLYPVLKAQGRKPIGEIQQFITRVQS